MKVSRPIDITTDQRKTLLALLKRHLPNTTAWAYGSRVKWTSRPQSDLDLVVFTKPDQERRVSDLREVFEESNLPFRVDLLVWRTLPEQYRKQIEAEHVVLVEKDERGVPSGWHERRWGDLATLEYGRALRGYDIALGAFRVFGTNGPIGWHDEALCPHASVVVGRKGAYRGIHYSAEPFFVIDTAFYLKPKVEMDVRWAYYELLTQDINLIDSGSAIPSTSREEFYGLPVSAPPLPEQRAIAHVLGTLDDKIELNRRMNETLEAMARALFKSWFVDFDPVRAKAALRNHSPLEGESARQGRSPQPSRWGDERSSQDESLSGRGYPPPHQPSPRGSTSATPPQGGSDWTVERARAYLDNMDKEIADLFPDRLVDSELGPIPEGWERGTLEDVALLNPESWSTQNAPEEIVYVDLSNTKRGYIEKMETYPWQTAPSRGRRVLRNGDTIVGTVRPGNGSFSLISRDGLTGSTGFAVLRPKLWNDRELVWCIATSKDNIDRLAHLADGGAYPAVRPETVSATEFILADMTVRKAFSSAIAPLLDQIEYNKHQSHTLTIIHDALLPKLISGELRIPEAEEYGGAADI